MIWELHIRMFRCERVVGFTVGTVGGALVYFCIFCTLMADFEFVFRGELVSLVSSSSSTSVSSTTTSLTMIGPFSSSSMCGIFDGDDMLLSSVI